MTRMPQLGGSGGIPSGVITMWSGPTSDIPDGWVLCDGSDDTPDLRDRFVTGAGGQYAVGDTGGTDEVQLTVDELPSHRHSMNFSDNDGYSGAVPESNSDYTSQTAYTNNTGGDQPHENRPPYYALAFIMKT